jgi:NAD(P)-dependent dehydrogenase (short-subunit alcohol dehydrogenase family)
MRQRRIKVDALVSDHYTSPADAQAAVQAALKLFGRIDVLSNNAAKGNGQTKI